MKQRVELDYQPREWQRAFHAGVRGKRHGVAVVGRQSGKTHCAVFEMVSRALSGPGGAAYALVMPYQSQVRRILWPRLKGALAPFGSLVQFRETDLICTLPNDVKIYALGADNETARGLSLRGILVDEFDNISIEIWKSVFLPTLTSHGSESWTLFIGTLSGSASRLWKMVEEHRGDEAWHVQVTPASEIVEHDPEFLKTQRLMMGETAYLREYECDPSAPVERSVLGELMNRARDDGRIKDFPLAYPSEVHTAWDLGIRDATSVWLYQLVGNYIQVYAYREYGGIGLDEIIRRLKKEFDVDWGDCVLPHDISVREYTTGVSRIETFYEMRFGTPEPLGDAVGKRPSPADTLNATRINMPRCVFNEEECGKGIQHLKNARYIVDTKTDTVTDKILHDDASHALDAFRYLCTYVEARWPAANIEGFTGSSKIHITAKRAHGRGARRH